jgi:catechol 2,3-dioxygenase-like lactoylglutathione lyase family enzyme
VPELIGRPLARREGCPLPARPFVSEATLPTCSKLGANRAGTPERRNEMKVSSISGITCYVSDLFRTAEFYETIGFRRGKEEPDRVTFYVNWFFVTFIVQERQEVAERGSGLFTYVKVDNVDDYHEALVSKGFSPESEPQARHGGQREFVLRDPDGYQLVFFEKK